MIEWLEPKEIPGHLPSTPNGASHPMRVMTRRAAGLEGDGWDDTARREVAGLFDDLAVEWHTRTSPEREAAVLDALDRGVPADAPRGLAVEVGSGIGAYSAHLAARWATAIAVEISVEMARLAPTGPAHRVIADGARLPLADGAADAVVLINAFLFPAEVERVLAPGGVLLWANLSGESTPIHLPPEEVVAALPGTWSGRAARAGSGLWTVLRQSL